MQSNKTKEMLIQYKSQFSVWIKKHWNKHYTRYQSDNDYKIIYCATILLMIVSFIIWLFPAFSKDSQYDRGLITLQIQLAGVCLATVAAIIAFKNYQRKSGNELYYSTLVRANERLPHVDGIAIYNAKDKACVIFAIDFLLQDSKERIRLFQDDSNPVVVSAYSSVVIKLEKTSKYSNEFIPSSFTRDNISCVCMTHTGGVIAEVADMDELTIEFKASCIRPLTI